MEPLVLCVVDVFVDMADVVETPRRKKNIISPYYLHVNLPKFKKENTIYGDLKLPTPCWSIMTCSNIEKKLLQNTRSTFHAAIPFHAAIWEAESSYRFQRRQKCSNGKIPLSQKTASSMENGRFFSPANNGKIHSWCFNKPQRH